MPRHPPYALKHLQQRCSRPLCSSQTTHNTRTHVAPAGTLAPRYDHAQVLSFLPSRRSLTCSLRTQQYADITLFPPALGPAVVKNNTCQCSTHEHHGITCESEMALPSHAPRLFGVCGEMLLRKEVIQPHLPVRLPCYDFVPIADPTFDSSLPQGVRPPASGVTDFHDVTGGVYKARERIHRSVADLRLLATPTSRGRVADPDPN